VRGAGTVTQAVRGAGTVTQAVRGAEPAWFAMVMATGIVSAALRQAGWPGPARVLRGGAAACFVVIAAAVGWRAVRHPAGLAAQLGQAPSGGETAQVTR
jgi:tellurite resistance protein TehA-like permease